MRLLRTGLVSALLAFTAAACGGSSQAAAPRQPQPATATADDPSCPVTVPGTSVTVEDTPSGAALVFVTTGDAAEVQKRVAAMAEMHNDHHGAMGPLPDGADAGGGHEGHGAHAGHEMGGGAGHDGHDMSGGGHAGHDMSGGKHAGHAGGMIGVHSKASVEPVQGGAKLVLTAGGADVAKLQSELRMHAQHFASGTCEMGSH